ncbi:MAG: ketol-acid reductoisomerase [Gemmatimonadetes bacterium]|nr:ketol-acid reductoisomerase [Gemmatimonadota bacterium]
MTARVYYDADASLDPLRGQRIAVVGYGSQGRAHALNLADSGLDVVVGLREGSPSWRRAVEDGTRVATVDQACDGADLIAMLVPDQDQPALYRASVEPALRPGAAVLFAHGLNIHYSRIRPDPTVDVVLVGPKAPGPWVRTAFERGAGVPTLIAVHADASGRALERALAYSKGIGCTRAGAIETTFAEETETDLFGEQAVLAGATARLVQAGFDTLVNAGYQPEVAYFECLHELKFVVDLLYRSGITGLRGAISDVAKYGSLTRGRKVIGAEVEATMRRVLEDIRSGAFARELLSEAEAGYPTVAAERRREAAHLIEEIGPRLRAMMPDVG